MLTYDDVNDLKTPCYLFDEVELRQNFKDFNAALQEGWSKDSCVAYSVKTTHIPWVLEVSKECGCMAEVVSDDEYELAATCGYAPDEIVFNGPIKGREFFEYALAHGSLVNIDSVRELRWAEELAQAGKQVKAGIRANIMLERLCPGECLSDEHHGRFGFSYETGKLAEAVSELRAHGVMVNGLHMHVTTRSRSLKVYDTLSAHASKIVDELGLDLDYVDMGGGFFGGGPKNVGAYEDYVRVIAENLKRSLDPEKTRLLVEPGGAVVCTPGYYIGRIIDAKDIGDERYVVSELSRINIDHEMKKTAYNTTIFAKSEDAHPAQRLCGYTCMDSDRLCILEDEPELAEGDIVVINYAGAYSSTFTPEMFIQHPPAVYAKGEDGLYCVREKHQPAI
ncbi:MAG: pyridoxal-dependent decarboxylase [Eggerthellaceae bacterium]|nr:pyridoxal-dependent decarboxylase [Eggerthellaceae bacterium]